MYTRNNAMKKPAGDVNPSAGRTYKLTVQTSAEQDKAFATLAAGFALVGHSLVRVSTDGSAIYAMPWGLIKPLANMYGAKRFLARIGGGQ